jgi:hypothetical protein
MGTCLSKKSFEPDGDMTGVGEYKNLNPFMAKKESALFRQKIHQILDSVRLQCNTTSGMGYGSGGGFGFGSIGLSQVRGRGGGRLSSCAGGFVEVVQAAEDEFGVPLPIAETDLREVATVLRIFSTSVRDEIVGACLLARPKAYHAYGYDYSKSAVLTMRFGSKVCTAAVVTLRVINSTTRCLEVSWVATLRDYRKRGHASLLFGYIQQIAAVMGIEAVLVLSSRTSVGYWLTQPRPSSCPRTIMVRAKHSDKRLTKGYSKMAPRKLQKLEAGLRRCEVFEEPPNTVKKFYSKDSPFRFNFANSIHVWYLLGLEHVDYLSLAKSGSTEHHPSTSSGMNKKIRKGIGNVGGSSSGKGSSGKGSSGKGSSVAVSGSGNEDSSDLQAKFLKSAANSAARQAGSDLLKRSRSLPSSPSSPHRPGNDWSGKTTPMRRHSSDRLTNKNALSPYKVKSIAAAKLAARKLNMKSKRKRARADSKDKYVADVPQTT